jgi:hypothetical protein
MPAAGGPGTATVAVRFTERGWSRLEEEPEAECSVCVNANLPRSLGTTVDWTRSSKAPEPHGKPVLPTKARWRASGCGNVRDESSSGLSLHSAKMSSPKL